MTQSSSSSSSSSSVTVLSMSPPDSTTKRRVSTNSNGALHNGSVSNGSVSNGSVSNGKVSVSNGSVSNGSVRSKEQLLVSCQRCIFLSLFLGYACYTYTRKSVSYAAPTLLAAGLVTTNTIGAISSCQNMAYAVSKFLGGVLSDRMSARVLFSFGLAVSGTSTLLFSRTENPALWSFLWGVNGFAQGCGWPSCAKLLKKWFSPANFGTWWSVLTASSNLSGTLSPLLAAYVIINHGWEASLSIAGLLSLAMAVVTFFTIIDDPELADLPDPSRPDLAKPSREKEKQTPKTTEEKKGGLKDLIKSPFLWLVSACYLCVFLAKTAISEWGQLYLMSELNRTQMEASSFTSAMETGGFFGGILAGVLTDRIASKVNLRANVRLLVAAVFMCVCCVGLYVLAAVLTPTSSQVLVSGVGVVLGASMFGPISIYGIVASESFPPHLSGTAHACVALAANVGAVLAGWPLSKVARAWSWRVVLMVLQVLSAGAAMLIVTTTRSHVVKRAKQE